jgi:hypothetical protein
MRSVALAIVAAAGLSSCQSFQSHHVDLGASNMPGGMHYAVPKALMTVELQQESGDLWLGVSRPFLIGDPEATYALTATSGLFADQRYKIRVDPQTRLLDYISSVSEGRATQILSNLGQSFGAIGALPRDLEENSLRPSNDAVQVFSQVFDPMAGANCSFGDKCELTDLSDLLHRKAREFLKCRTATPQSPTAVKCAELGDANTRGRNERGEIERYFSISLDPLFKIERRPDSGRATAPASCANSICYRAPAPYLLRISVEGQRDVSEIVMLPNEAPIMSLDLPAGVFATSRSRVDLVYGMPARMEVDQGNELVGITAIPLTVINSFFKAVGEVFQLRINYDSRYQQVLESDVRRQQAQDRYDEEQRRRNPAAADRSVDAAIAPAPEGDPPEDFEDGSEDFGDEPETTADYLEKDQGASEADQEDAFTTAQRATVTIVPGPSPLLFYVPLQPKSKALPSENLDGEAEDGGSVGDDGDEPG